MFLFRQNLFIVGFFVRYQCPDMRYSGTNPDLARLMVVTSYAFTMSLNFYLNFRFDHICQVHEHASEAK